MRTRGLNISKTMITVFAVIVIIASNTYADTAYWADWQSSVNGKPGSASGVMNFADESVDVTYNGEVYFAQTSGGTNYWNPSTPYISTEVSNAPPASDIIALCGGNTIVNTISFSKPVVDPVMAIVSLGQGGVSVRYEFNAPFEILSCGRGYWGGGPTSLYIGTSPNILVGNEGHGTIQFSGTYSSISWTVPVYEGWHGFTVGAMAIATTTAVTLASFDALPGDRMNELVWTTGDETNNIGFNIYRSQTLDGDYEKINSELIVSKAGSGLGADYSFIDQDVRNRTTYWYTIEDIDFKGTATMHGPVSATPRFFYGLFQ